MLGSVMRQAPGLAVLVQKTARSLLPVLVAASAIDPPSALPSAGSAFGTSSSAEPRSRVLQPEAPDPAVQAFLQGMLSEDEGRMFDGDEEDLQKVLQELNALVGGDHARLVSQFLHFMADAKSMKEGMLPPALTSLMSISNRDIALGLLPFLDAADSKLRKEALDTLAGSVESDRATHERSFKTYRGILEDLGFDRFPSLVPHMYEIDPERGLRTLAAVISGDDGASRLLEQDIDRDPETLRRLSNRPEWWIRLYAAAVLARNPQLGEDVLERLRNDSHPTIRRFLEGTPAAAGSASSPR